MCNIIIRRESKITGMARAIKVYVDGIPAGNISNGGMITLEVSSGIHQISFGLGSAINTDAQVTVPEEHNSFGMACWFNNDFSIEVVVQDVSIQRSITQRGNNISGTKMLLIVIAIIVLLWLIFRFTLILSLFS